jgi:hypothetical protein
MACHVPMQEGAMTDTAISRFSARLPAAAYGVHSACPVGAMTVWVVDAVVVREDADLTVACIELENENAARAPAAQQGRATAPAPRAPAVPSVPQPPDVDEIYARVTRLGELRGAGLLTDEEFATQKSRLLGA